MTRKLADQDRRFGQPGMPALVKRAAKQLALVCACAGLLTFAHAEPGTDDALAKLQTSQTQTKPGLIGSAVASTTSMATGVASKAGDLVLNALSMIGVRYRFGGNTPDSGLDCSGFVRYVFNDTLGFLLPRRSAEMSKVGETISSNELKPGDLVFFNTMRHAFSHVGIYIGDNKFVHAPSRGQEIRIDDMKQAYWSQRYNGARRIEVVQASLQSKGGERISTGDPRIDAILDQMKRDGRL